MAAVIASSGPSGTGLATGWNHAALLAGAINLAGAALAALAIARHHHNRTHRSDTRPRT